jgi:hypothetical protein
MRRADLLKLASVLRTLAHQGARTAPATVGSDCGSK